MSEYTTDYSKSPRQMILDLINAKNGTNVPLEAVLFGTPSVNETDVGSATALSVAAADGSGYAGSQDFTYNRVDLGFMNVNAPDLVIQTDATDVIQLIPFFNNTFGINLSEDDIEAFDLTGLQSGVATPVSLTATPVSLVFTGAVKLNIVSTIPAPTEAPTDAPTDAPAPAPIELSSIFVQTNLGDLTPPPAPLPTAADPAPTDAPTDAPTEAVTEAPTEVPTEAPVAEEPTEAPTEAATEAPVEDAPVADVAPTEAPAADDSASA